MVLPNATNKDAKYHKLILSNSM